MYLKIFLISLTMPFFAKSSLMDKFEQWIHNFKIKFNDDIHFYTMYRNWRDNNEFIDKINSLNLTYELGHNQFSGMNDEEFRNYLGYTQEKNYFTSTSSLRGFKENIIESSLPSSINWVEKGGVTPVKDQGQCGSCWSFSTTGALEGAYYVSTQKLLSFSEQQLVDCDSFKNGGKDHGCNGGLMDNAFSWIQKNEGLCKEENYPYVSGTTKTAETCQKTCINEDNSKISSFVDVPPSSDSDMMHAISKQPVSIAIQADQKEFQLYKSGVFTGPCGTKLDHGVLVVGYGTLSGEDYYLVKNSWSSQWGDDGYIKLGRGKQYNNGDGQCGLLLEGSYPLL
jgi:KDEL-tailed cysteine endopeptidase